MTAPILRRVDEQEIDDATSLRSAEAAGAPREPAVCTAADAKGGAVLACAPAANR
ncbi:MAG TPA: hypothetical protein VHP37_00815 [Burkholderiales bacterium]|nr:hypothetical protein [Burkholderiales bacterium]